MRWSNPLTATMSDFHPEALHPFHVDRVVVSAFKSERTKGCRINRKHFRDHGRPFAATR